MKVSKRYGITYTSYGMLSVTVCFGNPGDIAAFMEFLNSEESE